MFSQSDQLSSCLFFLLAPSDPVSTGAHQRGSGRSDQSYPAAAVGPSLQAQRDPAVHLRGLTISSPSPSHARRVLASASDAVFSLPSRQDYVAAMEDFQQSLELKKNQPIAMLYKGLTFFHRGMLKVRRHTSSACRSFHLNILPICALSKVYTRSRIKEIWFNFRFCQTINFF